MKLKVAAGAGAAVLAYLASLSNLIVITIGSLLAYSLYRYYEFVAHYPRGPFPLPFIGNIMEIDPKVIHKSLERVGKDQSGGMYTMFIPHPVVQITDFDVMREAFIKNGDAFAGRPHNRIIQEVFSFAPNAGVINSTGDVWREQRRAAVAILRDFGMGKNVMEQLVRSSVEDYLAHLETIADKENVDLRWPIQVMVANVINEVLFGFRYNYGDCRRLIDYVTSVNENRGVGIAMAMPSITRIPWIRQRTIGKTEARMKEINLYIVDNVTRALETYNVEDEPTCFVHAYKQRMLDNSNLDDVNLMTTCADFFLAGQETTTTTLRWAMIIMARHQDVQEKLRQEIHAVVGTERLPSMADQVKLPYARACALELQRFANILGTNVQRTTTQDVTIRGQTIPAGTWVNADIHFVMANDPVFEKADEFRPERYLDGDQTSLRKDLVERTIPFSMGKRACAGEGLARVEIFLGLTATVQRYRILARDGVEIDLEPTMASTIKLPKPQCLRLQQVI